MNFRNIRKCTKKGIQGRGENLWKNKKLKISCQTPVKKQIFNPILTLILTWYLKRVEPPAGLDSSGPTITIVRDL